MTFQIEGFSLHTDNSRLRATADVTFFDAKGELFFIRGLKLLQKRGGLVLGFPTVRHGDDFIEVCALLNDSVFSALYYAMRSRYRKALDAIDIEKEGSQ